MASQEFLASFAVEIDEGGVTRLQQVLEENRDLANEVAAAFEAATAAIQEYQKVALGEDNPSGEGNRDDGSGTGSSSNSAEGNRDTGSPYNPEASARNLENGEYRSDGYKGEIQSLLSGSLTSNPDSSARDYSLRTAELSLAHALAPDEEYDRNTGSRVNPDSFYGDQQGAYLDSHEGLSSEISRYLYNQIGPRANSDYARELNAALQDLASAEAKGDDTAEYLEQVKSLMPDLIQGVKDIVDKYDEPPEATTTESGEGEGSGLEGSLDLEGARGELEAFREEASQPVNLSGNASGIVSAASAALSSVKSMFSTPITIKAVVETEGGGEGGDGGDSGGSTLKMSTGGRFTKPTDVQVAEDGDAEYIIPVKKENRAVPLLKQLMTELSPEARQSLVGDNETAGAIREPAGETATQPLPAIREAVGTPAATQPLASSARKETAPDAGTSGLLAKLGDLLSTSLHETVAPVVQNTSQNVSAPVTIQVRSTGANAEQIGQKLYDTTERYLLRTLRGVMG